MSERTPTRYELFVAAVFLANGVLGTGIALTSGGEFGAWYGGFMLMAGWGMIDSWRLRRKLAHVREESAKRLSPTT